MPYSAASSRPYHDRVDRLDSWLNSQAGWRRAVLVWLQMWPPAIMFGCTFWSSTMTGAPGPGLEFFGVVALSVLAAVPLAGAMVPVLRWRVARNGRPVFSWCMYAGTLCMMAEVLLNELTDQQPYWHHIHRAVGLVSLALALGAAGFSFEAIRRYRRMGSLRRVPARDQPGQQDLRGPA